MHHKTIVIGRLGADPETKYLPSGDAVTNFSVAATDSWKNKETGEKQEHTEWYRCAAFGRLAEVIAEYRKKGDLIYIEGKNRTRKWQDQEGNDRYSTEVRVDVCRGLSRPEGQGSRPAQGQAEETPQGQPGKPQTEDFDDDIPF